jgi:putative heme-binding domain-containing protein
MGTPAIKIGTGIRTVAVVALLIYMGSAVLLAAQTPSVRKPGTNPKAGNASAIKEGASLFRANCSPCHGLSAKGGGRGPDLTTGYFAHGSSDKEIFNTITQGVPGTDMPANTFEDSETWALIAYIRSRSANAGPRVLPGDAAKGKMIFLGAGNCAQCHMVNGAGGRLGPDLSRVGAARSAAYLKESVREPDKELSNGMLDPNRFYGLPMLYEKVTVVTNSGETIVGVPRNEDTFSIQLLDQDERLRFLLKKDLKEVREERKSLMPAYTEDMLSATELQDLVAYLASLGRK